MRKITTRFILGSTAIVALTMSACTGSPASADRMVAAQVTYARSEGSPVTSGGTVRLFIRFFDSSLDASVADLECPMVAQGQDFACSQTLMMPVNAGREEHHIWVRDSTRSAFGSSEAGVTASTIHINGENVRVVPNPLYEIGAFRIDSQGSIR